MPPFESTSLLFVLDEEEVVLLLDDEDVELTGYSEKMSPEMLSSVPAAGCC